MDFELSKCELNDLESALNEDDLKPKIRRKLMALKMRAAGIPLAMIASSLSISVRTVSNYIAEFREGGLKATMEDRAYCPESCLEPFLTQIEDDFREQPVGCAKQARERILKLTGIALSPSQTRRTMLRLGMRYRQAGQIPGKVDGQKQLEFLDNELRPS